MLQIQSASGMIARALPRGLPIVRDQVLARTGIFRSALKPDSSPGDPGLFGPGSATWRMMGEPGQILVGIRAALLQALSAPILTATESTGAFRKDFTGRVNRTGAFVQAQNLGSMDEVFKSARRVRAMHRVVHGISDEGVDFDADDAHQQAWVSMTMTDSYLAIAETFGSGRWPDERADRFVREQSIHGALLDPRVDLAAVFEDPEQRAALQAGTLPLPLIEEGELPETRAQLDALMRSWVDELYVTPMTRTIIDATVQLSALPTPQRSIARPFVLAAIATVPDYLHDLLAPDESRLEEFVATQVVQAPLGLMHALFGPTPALDVAHERVARRAA